MAFCSSRRIEEVTFNKHQESDARLIDELAMGFYRFFFVSVVPMVTQVNHCCLMAASLILIVPFF